MYFLGNYHVTDRPYPRGEIVIGGNCISAGYFKNDLLTQEAFREEEGTRWFYTGDIGEIHPDGAIKIIDRKKDLVKLQFGEYISLGKVETELKSSPFVENICVYADSGHTYVIAFVTPNRKPLLELAATLRIKEIEDEEQLFSNKQLVAAVKQQLDKHGRAAGLNRMEIPQKIKLCSEIWTPDNGFVTAALKIRRIPIKEHYMKDIEEMYSDRC